MPDYTEVKLNIPGMDKEIWIDTYSDDELVSTIIQKDRIWEAFETELFIQHLNQGDGVLDVGANIGYYSLIASSLVGDSGKVFSFEPDSENFRLLKKNILKNKLDNVKSFNSGLGKIEGHIDFYVNKNNRGDHRAFENDESSEVTRVSIMKGDSVAPDIVHFIKIDTQGFELNILKGLRETIQRNSMHLKMIVEFWPYALRENGASSKELIDELKQYPFDVKLIDHINHKLIESDWQQLLSYAENELDSEHKGFANLFLQPTPTPTLQP